MEGASIAHGAYLNGIPFVIIRAISDKADDSAEMDYPTFERGRSAPLRQAGRGYDAPDPDPGGYPVDRKQCLLHRLCRQ